VNAGSVQGEDEGWAPIAQTKFTKKDEMLRIQVGVGAGGCAGGVNGG
jgi:hypothetical protein